MKSSFKHKLGNCSKGDTEKDRLITEAEEEGVEKASLWSILRESKQEWLYLAIGVFAAIVQGIIMPAFSMFYSQIFSVCVKIEDDV